MKSRRFYKQTIKSENLPQGQNKAEETDKNKNGYSSKVYTVKETTIEKKVKRSSFNSGGDKNISSNLKQGTNSGFSSQNKIPVSNKEDKDSKISNYRGFRSRFLANKFKDKVYTKAEVDKIIKIQRWWRRMMAILDGYKIRESLFGQNSGNYVVKSKKIYTEEYTSSNRDSNKPSFPNFKNSNSYTNIMNLNNMNTGTRSYTNINNVTTNIKRNFDSNIKLKSSSSQNYIQTIDKRIITQTSPRMVQSVSTSPSIKGRYIIETKKIEVFRKPRMFTDSQFVNEKNYAQINTMSNYEVKHIMKDIWNDEVFCSTVESLCCLGDEGKNNGSQNTLVYEEYEEEIKKLKKMLMQKDNELNNLMENLRDTRNQLNVNITKKMKEIRSYPQKNFDQDAHELQIISTKLGWNDVNIPSPVNEIFIESIENKFPQRMQYIEGLQIMGKRIDESIQESVTDPEAVLEIQEMNALSIISNKIKPKNMCQHLQSLMILSKRNE